MQTLPVDLLDLIVVFQPLFTKPNWEHAKILLLGALLARGKRTVTACLRVVGLKDDEHFQNYHRVLNRTRWKTLEASRILLGRILIVLACLTNEVITLLWAERSWALPFLTVLCPAKLEGQPSKAPTGGKNTASEQCLV